MASMDFEKILIVHLLDWVVVKRWKIGRTRVARLDCWY